MTSIEAVPIGSAAESRLERLRALADDLDGAAAAAAAAATTSSTTTTTTNTTTTASAAQAAASIRLATDLLSDQVGELRAKADELAENQHGTVNARLVKAARAILQEASAKLDFALRKELIKLSFGLVDSVRFAFDESAEDAEALALVRTDVDVATTDFTVAPAFDRAVGAWVEAELQPLLADSYGAVLRLALARAEAILASHLDEAIASAEDALDALDDDADDAADASDAGADAADADAERDAVSSAAHASTRLAPIPQEPSSISLSPAASPAPVAAPRRAPTPVAAAAATPVTVAVPAASGHQQQQPQLPSPTADAVVHDKLDAADQDTADHGHADVATPPRSKDASPSGSPAPAPASAPASASDAAADKKKGFGFKSMLSHLTKARPKPAARRASDFSALASDSKDAPSGPASAPASDELATPQTIVHDAMTAEPASDASHANTNASHEALSPVERGEELLRRSVAEAEHQTDAADHADAAADHDAAAHADDAHHEIRAKKPMPTNAMMALASVMRGNGASSPLRRSVVEVDPAETAAASDDAHAHTHAQAPAVVPRPRPPVPEPSPARISATSLEDVNAVHDAPSASAAPPPVAPRSAASRPASVAVDHDAAAETDAAPAPAPAPVPVPRPMPPATAPRARPASAVDAGASSSPDRPPAVAPRPQSEIVLESDVAAHHDTPTNPSPSPSAGGPPPVRPRPPAVASRPGSLVVNDRPVSHASDDGLQAASGSTEDVAAAPGSASTGGAPVPPPKKIPGVFTTNHSALGALAAAMNARSSAPRPASRPTSVAIEHTDAPSADHGDHADAPAPAHDDTQHHHADGAHDDAHHADADHAAVHGTHSAVRHGNDMLASSPSKPSGGYLGTPMTFKRKENSISGDDKALEKVRHALTLPLSLSSTHHPVPPLTSQLPPTARSRLDEPAPCRQGHPHRRPLQQLCRLAQPHLRARGTHGRDGGPLLQEAHAARAPHRQHGRRAVVFGQAERADGVYGPAGSAGRQQGQDPDAVPVHSQGVPLIPRHSPSSSPHLNWFVFPPFPLSLSLPLLQCPHLQVQVSNKVKRPVQK
ncbi:hypothetical protein BC831DRAFT_554019, partial [Entophlyctis helioformis]